MEEMNISKSNGLAWVASAQLAALLLGTALWLLLALLIHPLAYGHLIWLISIATILSTLCTFGLGKTIITHLPTEKDSKFLSSAVAVVILLSLIAGTILSIVLEPAIGLLTIGLSLFSITVHLYLANRKYEGYLRAWAGARILGLLLPVLFYLLWGSITGILVGLALAYLSFGSKALAHLRTRPDFRRILRVLTFTLGVLGTDLNRVFMSFLDKILIGELFGMEVLGLYHFAFRIFLLFGTLPQIMLFYLLPEKSAGRDTEKIERIAVIASFGLAAATYLFAHFVVPLAFPAFAGSVNAIQIMGLAIIPATLVGIKTSSLYSEGKTNVVFGSHLLALGVGIIGIIFLGRRFGLVGIALSMVALQWSLAAALFLFSKLAGETRKIAAGSIAALVLVGLLLGSVGAQRPQIKIRGYALRGMVMAMGTVVNITVIDEDTQRAEAAMQDAFNEIFRIERLMSATDGYSEIYILNQSRGEWVDLSPETIYVLERSLYFAKISGGAFDPTVKPLVDLWMEKVKTWGRLPSTSELSEALALVNWRNLEVDVNKSRARFLKEGMAITLGGIAKGYAVDRAIKVLKESGVKRGLVDIGGDIRGFGPKSWRIAIQHPRDEYEWLDVIDLKNAAVATSGDYRRFFLLGERRVHHILNPKTGEPADRVMSVTIIAANCLDADALTTLVFVLGPEKGKELLNSLEVAGLIVDSHGEIIISEAWELKHQPASSP
ncbi:FAD:protein FMN transferase [Candidatus Acetothermia bacterium]|nr:FAD:protein FMN transferase [Candidatus Acetothermia bacterium]